MVRTIYPYFYRAWSRTWEGRKIQDVIDTKNVSISCLLDSLDAPQASAISHLLSSIYSKLSRCRFHALQIGASSHHPYQIDHRAVCQRMLFGADQSEHLVEVSSNCLTPLAVAGSILPCDISSARP